MVDWVKTKLSTRNLRVLIIDQDRCRQITVINLWSESHWIEMEALLRINSAVFERITWIHKRNLLFIRWPWVFFIYFLFYLAFFTFVIGKYFLCSLCLCIRLNNSIQLIRYIGGIKQLYVVVEYVLLYKIIKQQLFLEIIKIWNVNQQVHTVDLTLWSIMHGLIHGAISPLP